MSEKWLLIFESYKKAEEYLSCSEQAYGRNREKGKAYLYEAYHDALKEAGKDHLCYARILFMMYEYHRGRYDERMLFYSFLNEAFHEYMLAAAEHGESERAETEQAERAYRKAKRYIEMQSCRKDMYRELNSILGGIMLPGDFRFCGSRIIFFRHDINTAELKLENGGMTVSFVFSGIYEITADLLPSSALVSDIVCYRYPDSKAVMFDIGFYKILCTEIGLTDISEYEK